MIDFQYTASDANGKISRGQLFAIDKHDLSRQLQVVGLFLVSCADIHEQPPEPIAVVPEAVASEPVMSPVEDRRSDSTTVENTRRQKFFIVGIFIGGIALGFWRWHTAPARLDVSVLNQRIPLLRTDSTRADIEHILGPSTVSPNGSASRYFVPPYWAVDVIYNDRGERKSFQNVPIANGVQISRISNYPKK